MLLTLKNLVLTSLKLDLLTYEINICQSLERGIFDIFLNHLCFDVLPDRAGTHFIIGQIAVRHVMAKFICMFRIIGKGVVDLAHQ